MRAVAWIAAAAWAIAGAAAGETLLRDDFDAPALDAARWRQPEGCGSYYGRTQIRPPEQPLAIEDGALQLVLDRYNPTGLSFLGSEAISQASFAPEGRGGVAVRARVRLVEPTSPGFDAALFLYAIRPPATACDASPPRDEIDFELLTSQLGSGKVLTNVYDAEPIGGAGAPAYPEVVGLDPRGWTLLELRWWGDAIEWRVDGARVRSERERVPAGPMAVHLDFWAPGAEFPEAFASPPDPVASPDANQQWRFAVDWVEVATIPEPAGALAAAAASACLSALRARAGARRGSRRWSRRSRGPTPEPDRPRDR